MTHPRRGFTLIELLLALALTSVLTAALSIMIGQAARDHRAMQQQTHAPNWSLVLVGTIERDLRQAQWWAGGEDRVVLIGLGRGGLPAEIEYRWTEAKNASVLTRKEVALAGGVAHHHADDEYILAIGLSEIQVGSFALGSVIPKEGSSSGVSNSVSASRAPLLLINGKPVPIEPLPDQLLISIQTDGEEVPRVQQKVVLR